MAGLALILEVIRVEAYGRVVAVRVVQPYLVMYYQPRLLVALLAHPSIHSYTHINVGLPGPAPRLGFIELFLGQHCLALRILSMHTGQGVKPAYTGKKMKKDQAARLIPYETIIFRIYCHALPGFCWPGFSGQVEQVVQMERCFLYNPIYTLYYTYTYITIIYIHIYI